MSRRVHECDKEANNDAEDLRKSTGSSCQRSIMEMGIFRTGSGGQLSSVLYEMVLMVFHKVASAVVWEMVPSVV